MSQKADIEAIRQAMGERHRERLGLPQPVRFTSILGIDLARGLIANGAREAQQVTAPPPPAPDTEITTARLLEWAWSLQEETFSDFVKSRINKPKQNGLTDFRWMEEGKPVKGMWRESAIKTELRRQSDARKAKKRGEPDQGECGVASVNWLAMKRKA